MSVKPPAFQNTISTGQILNAGTLTAAVLSLWFVFGSGRDAKDALAKSDALEVKWEKYQQSIAVQIDGIKLAMLGGFDRVTKQIESLPVITDRMATTDRQVRELYDLQKVLTSAQSATDRTAYDAREATKRLEQRIDALDTAVRSPVPVRTTR